MSYYSNKKKRKENRLKSLNQKTQHTHRVYNEHHLFAGVLLQTLRILFIIIAIQSLHLLWLARHVRKQN